MRRPKKGEYWWIKDKFYHVFITAVGVRHVLAVDYNDLIERQFRIDDLLGRYDKKAKKP